jgi:hypothetical protein
VTLLNDDDSEYGHERTCEHHIYDGEVAACIARGEERAGGCR